MLFLDDFQKAIKIGEFASLSNPRSFEMSNNLAYAFARLGDTNSAKIHLNKMEGLLDNNRRRELFLRRQAG